MATSLSFASNVLQSANILVDTIDHFSVPTSDTKPYPVAHENYSVIPFISYPSKLIVVKGVVVDNSIAALDARLDTFRAYFSSLNNASNLDIDYNGTTRRYIATVQDLKVDRPGGLLYANFTLTFFCTQPFGRDTAATTALSATARTLASYNDNYTFLGTAPYQLPIVTITLTAVSATGNQTMTFGNNGNGQAINITRTWTAGDVVVIDVTQKTVTVNGIPANFSGGFPEFPPGAQQLGYSDSFTSRTFNITATYTVMYL